MTEEPHLRKPLGVFLLVALMTAYVVAVAWLFDPVVRLPVLVQTPIWIVLGIAWVFPMKPLLRWIETGRWT